MSEASILQIGQTEDLRAIPGLLASVGISLWSTEQAPMDRLPLEAALRNAAGRPEVRLVVTVGGASALPWDVAPEALVAVCSRTLPGIPEVIRAALPNVEGALFRGQAGLRGDVLVVNLPGDGAAEASLSRILPAMARYLRQIDAASSTLLSLRAAY